MPALRTLRIGVFQQIGGFNIPLLLEKSDGLKNLEVYVSDWFKQRKIKRRKFLIAG